MSVYANADDEQAQVGTTRGWGEFTDWVDGLDVAGNEELIHLVEHGWTEKPDVARVQLSKAGIAVRDADVRSVIAGLAKFLSAQSGKVVVISNGIAAI